MVRSFLLFHRWAYHTKAQLGKLADGVTMMAEAYLEKGHGEPHGVRNEQES